MKNIIISILVGASTFTLIYLAFCFAIADFNIANWSDPARGFCAFSGFVLGTAIAFAYAHFSNE